MRPASATLVEVGPRDGLQNEPTPLDAAGKIELIRRAAGAGLRRIEATSFVHPGRVPAMADAEAVLAGLPDLPGASLSGLVLNERGLDRALAAGRLHEIGFAAAASESFSRRNQGASVAENLAAWARMAPRIRAAGLLGAVTIATAFGCPFEGEVPVARVAEIAGAVAAIGVDELSLADTIGAAGPRDVEERFAAVAAAAPGVPLRAHFHNTRNTGYANADAALRSGVATLDASLGGLGGCPFAPGATGNVATEDLAYLLERNGVRTGLDLAELREASLWLEGAMGRRLPAHGAHVAPFPPPA